MTPVSGRKRTGCSRPATPGARAGRTICWRCGNDDIEATIDGRSWGIECKHIAKGNLPFSAFRPNEVENLSRKEDAGGVAVVAVRRDAPAVDCFFPWYYIRDAIESGERGSVKLEGLPTDLLNVLEVVHP